MRFWKGVNLIDIEKLATNLFPENLPPVFTTRGIWGPYSGHGNSNYIITSNCVGGHATFNASKRGNQRRLFSIPHPAFVRDVSVFFHRHWTDISNIINSSSGSLSKPSFDRSQ